LAIDAVQRQEGKLLAGRRRERLSLYRAVGFAFLRVRQAEEVLMVSISAVLGMGGEPCAAALRRVYDGDAAALQLLVGRLQQEAGLSESATKLLGDFVEQRNWLMRGLIAPEDLDAAPAAGKRVEKGSPVDDEFGDDEFGDVMQRITEVGRCAAHVKIAFAGLLSAAIR
jgi:hypothetical protein